MIPRGEVAATHAGYRRIFFASARMQGVRRPRQEGAVGQPRKLKPHGKVSLARRMFADQSHFTRAFAPPWGFPAPRCIALSKRLNHPRNYRIFTHEIPKFTQRPAHSFQSAPSGVEDDLWNRGQHWSYQPGASTVWSDQAWAWSSSDLG